MLCVISPFSLYADVIPILLIAALGGFYMRPIEAFMQRGKHDGVFEHQINVSMRRSFLAHFIAQAPVEAPGQRADIGADDIMGEPVFLGIIDRKPILSAGLFSR